MPSSQPDILRLNLPQRALKRLQEVGVYCRSEVSLEYQGSQRNYVIRGIESGGAIREIGHYVTFSGLDGEPLQPLHFVDSLGTNGVHAIVVARTLVKVVMFRFGRTYQLLITKHQPSEVQDGRRPALLTEEIFRGSDGFLGLELYGKDKNQAGTVIPDFYSRAGEIMVIPAKFHAAVQAVTLASNCVACVHSHYLGPFVPSTEP